MGFNVINPEFPQALPSPQEKADQIYRAFADALDTEVLFYLVMTGNHQDLDRAFFDSAALIKCKQ